MATIKYLGHACFLITNEAGVRILTDPYRSGERLRYEPVTEQADVVLISHDHFDHNCVDCLPGTPLSLQDGGGTAEGLQFWTVAAEHDDEGGAARGENLVFCWQADGVRFCHLGDLGHALTPEQAAQIGPVDVLFAPVGGFYTLDPASLEGTLGLLQPRVLIPMHFRTEKTDLPIASVEEFLQERPDVVREGVSVWQVNAETLPAADRSGPQIVVLEPAN